MSGAQGEIYIEDSLDGDIDTDIDMQSRLYQGLRSQDNERLEKKLFLGPITFSPPHQNFFFI